MNGLRKIQVIHGALCAGASLFLLVSLSFLVEWNTLQFNFDSVFIYPLLIMWAGVFFVHKILYDKIKNKVKEEDELQLKINEYTSAKIIVWAFHEGLAMFSTTLLIIEPNFIFIGSALFGIFIMIIKYPNKVEMLNDFKINNDLI